MAVECSSECSPSRSEPSTSGRAYVQLDYDERRAIDRMRQRRVSVAEIASRLGRHRSTIYRELSRNRFVDNEWPDLGGYYAHVANDAVRKRRERLAKLVRIPSLADAVIERLEIGWSPEQIAGRLRLGGSGVRVCHETIYRFVYGERGQARDLFRFLPEHRRRRRPRRARRRHERFALDALAIRHRPAEIAARRKFGHWEGDLVLFRKEYCRANLTTLVERTTHFAVLMRNNDRTSKPVMNQIIDGLGTLPRHARRSFTFDRGTEFAAWRELNEGLQSQTWFCDPQSPWQKGAVENTNRRIRRFLPRSTDPLSITPALLADVTKRMNDTPRKCLDYRTPAEAFRAAVSKGETDG